MGSCEQRNITYNIIIMVQGENWKSTEQFKTFTYTISHFNRRNTG